MWNIVGKRYWFFAFSMLLTVPGLIALLLFGLPLAIDFTGGSLLKVEFQAAPPAPADVKVIFGNAGFPDSQVQTLSANGLQSRQDDGRRDQESDLGDDARPVWCRH